MFVRTLDDVIAAGRLKELQAGDTRSARYLTAADGMGFSLHLVSVFCPPLRGDEQHDADGALAPSGPVPPGPPGY